MDVILERIKDDSRPLIGLGYRLPQDKPLSEKKQQQIKVVKGMIHRAVIFEATNVSDYFWYGSHKENWEERDFPGMVPPYPVTWIEHRRPQRIAKQGLTAPPERYLPPQYAFLWIRVDDNHQDFNVQIVKEYPGVEPPEAKWIVIGIPFLAPSADEPMHIDQRVVAYLDESGNVIKWLLPDSLLDPEEIVLLPLEYPYLCYSSMLALSLLNCKNARVAEHTHSSALQKARKKRGHLPLAPYRTIEIDVLKSPIPKTKHGQPTGGHPAFHITRGHFALYGDKGRGLLFGKLAGLFWIPQHTKGGKSQEGEPQPKDYKIKPLKPQG